ncbi:protein of unknown function [Methylacidimicrobium sp. AP8]|nr:protein of unknown function [Methylacidimicrobium sp. AP8]
MDRALACRATVGVCWKAAKGSKLGAQAMRKVGGSVLVGAAAAIWTIVAGSPWAGHARAVQVSPQDRFLEAYVTLREADRLAAARDYAGAERGYQQALAQLSEIRRNYPDWEPAVIRYRIRYATGRLADAAKKAAAAGQGSPPRPPEGGSGRAPEDLRELVMLRSRIAELQAELARSQAQREQLFADLSRWRKEATERAPATGGAPAASRPLEREEVERLAKRLEQSVSQSLDTVSAIQKENRSLQNVLGRLRQEVADLPPAPPRRFPPARIGRSGRIAAREPSPPGGHRRPLRPGQAAGRRKAADLE